jgi:MoxR-like ATPase
MPTEMKSWLGDEETRLKNRQEIPAKWQEDIPVDPEPYIPAPGLVRAVRLAIYLGRPLLLEGEPGCGKTKLARSLAWELGLPFFEWYVNSASTARDGIYTYDALLRLHDVQLYTSLGADKCERNPANAEEYRSWNALGKAFELSREGFSSVVLIDEIDKADSNFPNDLLTVLDDDYKYTVAETGEKITGSKKREARPIIVVTSNREKGELPEPFLRRCLYYYVDFPDQDTLSRIVEAHDRQKTEQSLINAAVERFLGSVRTQTLKRKPGTSEFLDWLKVLSGFEDSGSESVVTPQLLETETPYPEVLFKVREDWSNNRHNP